VNPLLKLWSLAESQPDSLAIVSNSVQMNFRDLADNVARFAGAFRKAGIGKGQVIAIQLQPELEAVVIFACTQLGAATLSASKIILDSYSNDIDFLITGDELALSKVKKHIVINQEFMISLGSVAKIPEPQPLESEDLVRLSFSSGTTGVPKGIPFTAGRIPQRTASAEKNWMQATPNMSLLGLDTITGIISLFCTTSLGSTFYVSKGPKENLQLIKKYGIRSLETSPARLKDLIAESSEPETTQLANILVAGSLMTQELSKACETTFGLVPNYLYGSTEVGAATIGKFSSAANNRLGQLVSDVELEIVDDNLANVASGTTGNIRYRKPSMPEEYWKSKSTALNGFVGGWFYPGDRGLLSQDGYLFLEGRNDDVVNAAGNKFNLLTLDLWLAETRLFEEAASFTFSDQGETKIGLAFVAKNPPEPSFLFEKVKAFLPNLEISKLMRINSLPRNKMDKIDRKALAELI
jgi:acyl-coenzyme A synthetase/AMP-(fatty) acid ligase